MTPKKKDKAIIPQGSGNAEEQNANRNKGKNGDMLDEKWKQNISKKISELEAEKAALISSELIKQVNSWKETRLG